MTIFRFFKTAAARHLGYWKFAILNVLSCKECQCAASCRTSSTSLKRLRRYRDFIVFKLVAAAMLDLKKFNFLTADTLGRPSLRIPAKFYRDWPIRCWDMAIFRLFEMAAVRHVEFWKVRFLRFSTVQVSVRFTTSNSVEIGQTFA